MKIALKIDVDTLNGTLLGVPALADLLSRLQVPATFLFSLGPDHTGRALRRVFRRGFLGKVRRTSVLTHYGLKTLLYGTLLPGPDIGRRCAALLRDVRDRGFEVGIHCFDHVAWQDRVAEADAEWTRLQIQRAQEKFVDIFGAPATVHGAAGWQMNVAAFALEEAMGFTHASDTRGSTPFLPLIGSRPSRCVQLPTTLPTFDELLGREDLAEEQPVDHLLRLTGARPHDHVFTLHAELEGQRFLPGFVKLLVGWRRQGYEFMTLAGYAATLDRAKVPVQAVIAGAVPGRSGTLALQSS